MSWSEEAMKIILQLSLHILLASVKNFSQAIAPPIPPLHEIDRISLNSSTGRYGGLKYIVLIDELLIHVPASHCTTSVRSSTLLTLADSQLDLTEHGDISTIMV